MERRVPGSSVARIAVALLAASPLVASGSASAQEGQEPLAPATPATPADRVEPTAPAESRMSSPGLVAGGAALGVVGLGSTGLGVFLTLKGSTLDCIDCAGSSDDAPLVAGGLTAIVLGIGMAATGGTMVVLGWRDEPTGLRVRTEVRAGLDGVALHGSF